MCTYEEINGIVYVTKPTQEEIDEYDRRYPSEVISPLGHEESIDNDPYLSKPGKGKAVDKIRGIDGVANMITYATHIPKEEYKTWLKLKFASRGIMSKDIKFLEMAHETGETGDYPHTHVFYHLTHPFRARNKNMDVFDYQYEVPDLDMPKKRDGQPTMKIVRPPHPHIKRITGSTYILNAMHYLGKEDPENHKLKSGYDYAMQHMKRAIADGNPLQPVAMSMAKDYSQQEFFSKAITKVSDANSLKTIHSIMYKAPIYAQAMPETFLGWQTEAYEDILKGSAYHIAPIEGLKETRKKGDNTPLPMLEDNKHLGCRWIKVYYGPKGCDGKSVFQTALESFNPRLYYGVQIVPDYHNGATIISNALDSGWIGDTIMFNMTREQADQKIVKLFEACCDGKVTTQKYQGKTVNFPCKNVLLFTNNIPDLNGSSPDRWKFYEVDCCYYPDGRRSSTPAWRKKLSYADAVALRREALSKRNTDKVADAPDYRRRDRPDTDGN